MGTLSIERIIHAPREAVWKAIADVGYIHNWHPKVKASPVLSSSGTGVGAKRRCEFYDGSSVVEEVVAVEEGRSVRLSLSEFSMPFSRAAAVLEVEDVGDDKARITMTMDYETRYGPVGWLMDAAMIKPMMTSMLGEVLAGLDHHLRTGEYVGADGAAAAA